MKTFKVFVEWIAIFAKQVFTNMHIVYTAVFKAGAKVTVKCCKFLLLLLFCILKHGGLKLQVLISIYWRLHIKTWTIDTNQWVTLCVSPKVIHNFITLFNCSRLLKTQRESYYAILKPTCSTEYSICLWKKLSAIKKLKPVQASSVSSSFINSLSFM